MSITNDMKHTTSDIFGFLAVLRQDLFSPDWPKIHSVAQASFSDPFDSTLCMLALHTYKSIHDQPCVLGRYYRSS